MQKNFWFSIGANIHRYPARFKGIVESYLLKPDGSTSMFPDVLDFRRASFFLSKLAVKRGTSSGLLDRDSMGLYVLLEGKRQSRG
jgi:hypothetical protein